MDEVFELDADEDNHHLHNGSSDRHPHLHNHHLAKTEDGPPTPAIHHQDAEDVARDLDHYTGNGNQYDGDYGDICDYGDHLPEHEICVGPPT